MAIFDIYLLEALLNGVLLGGVLALLSLGLNLVFGVIDVAWICYAELIMLGMYAVYFLSVVYHVPLLAAGIVCIGGVAVLGVLLHVLVIAPLLGAAPINQLLATGGVLFFLQSAATVMFGVEFKNLGLRLPVLKLSGMFISYSRLLAFCFALVGMVLVYLFLTRTYTGTAIRAIAFTTDSQLGTIDTPNGSVDTMVIRSSVERRIVSVPPIAISEVEAKKAVPFCSDAMICASTMRMSRRNISCIHPSRWMCMRAFSPPRPYAVHSSTNP